MYKISHNNESLLLICNLSSVNISLPSPTLSPLTRAGVGQRRACGGGSGGAHRPEGGVVRAEQDLGEDRGVEGEAMALSGPEEDPPGAGRSRAAAEGIPGSSQELRLI